MLSILNHLLWESDEWELKRIRGSRLRITNAWLQEYQLNIFKHSPRIEFGSTAKKI